MKLIYRWYGGLHKHDTTTCSVLVVDLSLMFFLTNSEPVKVAYEKIDFDGFSSELTKYTVSYVYLVILFVSTQYNIYFN